MGRVLEIKQANPDVLIWAREGMRFDLDSAAQKAKIKKEILQAIEEKKIYPTKTQLIKLAKAYRRPWTLFLLPHVPKHTIKKPKWRTLLGVMENLSFKSLFIIRRAEDLQEIFSDLKSIGQSDIYSKKIELTDNPDQVAAYLRKILNITVKDQSKWDEIAIFDNWRSLVERHQILVLQGPINMKEIRAFSIVENTPYLIFVSSNDAINGRTFSLFHELTHILLRDSSLCKMSDFSEYHARRTEVFCNQVAASFLVPKEDLINHSLVQGTFRDEWDDKTLSILAKWFKVSREVVLRRLATLKLATKNFYEEKKAKWDKIPPKKPFGINKDTSLRLAKGCINANGYALTGAVLESLNNGNLSLTKASDYLGLKPKYVSRLEMVFNWNV